MAEECALESLAPELQLQILLNADTPEHLHALIQASPRLYQVYLSNKDNVLSAVACRQFHPTVISDAIFFAQISQLAQPLTRDTVTELCESYPGKIDDGKPLSIPMSVTLCKLASNLRFFIENYARNTLPIMEGLGRSEESDILTEYWPEKPVPYSKLSQVEIGRLQRAFCRFEIHRHLFARCSPNLGHDLRACPADPSLTPAEQASQFLQKFPDFQVTEIACVRDYLYRRLRGICSRLEDEAFATLPPETFMFDRDGDYESAEWGSGVWLFTSNGKAYQDDHIEHLMSLGLTYVRRLSEATGEEQRALFTRHIPRDIIHHLEKKFITKALECLGRNPARGDILLLAKTDPPFEYEVKTGIELDIPDAWQWAHPRAPPPYLKDDSVKGLRDWGYVFWDLDRLRESGITEKDRDHVRMIYFDEFQAADRPSVQERLLGPQTTFFSSEYDSGEDESGEDDSEELNVQEIFLGPPTAISSSEDGSDEDISDEWSSEEDDSDQDDSDKDDSIVEGSNEGNGDEDDSDSS